MVLFCVERNRGILLYQCPTLKNWVAFDGVMSDTLISSRSFQWSMFVRSSGFVITSISVLLRRCFFILRQPLRTTFNSHIHELRYKLRQGQIPWDWSETSEIDSHRRVHYRETQEMGLLALLLERFVEFLWLGVRCSGSSARRRRAYNRNLSRLFLNVFGRSTFSVRWRQSKALWHFNFA